MAVATVHRKYGLRDIFVNIHPEGTINLLRNSRIPESGLRRFRPTTAWMNSAEGADPLAQVFLYGLQYIIAFTCAV
jgi:hypothetical protein